MCQVHQDNASQETQTENVTEKEFNKAKNTDTTKILKTVVEDNALSLLLLHLLNLVN